MYKGKLANNVLSLTKLNISGPNDPEVKVDANKMPKIAAAYSCDADNVSTIYFTEKGLATAGSSKDFTQILDVSLDEIFSLCDDFVQVATVDYVANAHLRLDLLLTRNEEDIQKYAIEQALAKGILDNESKKLSIQYEGKFANLCTQRDIDVECKNHFINKAQVHEITDQGAYRSIWLKRDGMPSSARPIHSYLEKAKLEKVLKI